jgi:hypothetical protein
LTGVVGDRGVVAVYGCAGGNAETA